jgi:hypothetical protein
MEAAVAFNDFVENYSHVVTVEDLLDHGKFDKIKDFTINDHSAMVEKMENCEFFKEEWPQGRLKNLAKYFLLLPSEVAMKLWTSLGNANMENSIKLHGAEVDGRRVSDHLVKLLTGQEPGE